jgi:hypothetical protein
MFVSSRGSPFDVEFGCAKQMGEGAPNILGFARVNDVSRFKPMKYLMNLMDSVEPDDADSSSEYLNHAISAFFDSAILTSDVKQHNIHDHHTNRKMFQKQDCR